MREGLLPEKLCKRVNVDTTVQEKAITFPTDAKLYHKMRVNLVKAANKRNIAFFAVHGNPYDGHTLHKSLNQSNRLTQVKAEDAFVDRGYRGKENHPKDTRIFISGTKRLPDTLKKLLRGRSGIEPIIGHLKEDHGLSRNHLLGKAGDMINAV